MRLQIIEPEEADVQTQKIFKKLVMVPNVICQMANSPAVIETYFNFHTNLDQFKLSIKYQKMISLAVSQFNNCDYCIALHTATAVEGKILTEKECIEARQMSSADIKANAVLYFTKVVLNQRGKVDNEAISLVKKQGFNDQEIVEMIATVSFITLANFVANVGETELDFLEPPSIN